MKLSDKIQDCIDGYEESRVRDALLSEWAGDAAVIEADNDKLRATLRIMWDAVATNSAMFYKCSKAVAAFEKRIPGEGVMQK